MNGFGYVFPMHELDIDIGSVLNENNNGPVTIIKAALQESI